MALLDNPGVVKSCEGYIATISQRFH
jgi:hypothetical protein